MTTACQYIIRPVSVGDLKDLLALSKLAGPGFTSLQPDADFLRALITKSEISFERPNPEKGQTFLLVMQDITNGKVVGCASVKTRVGTDDFMCADFEVEEGECEATRYSEADCCLILRRTLQEYTEVGSLFLHPDHRKHGAGRYLARARYMLMGTSDTLFNRPIVAQLRGCCDTDGVSPFYEEVWSKRLGASYTENDARLAREGAKFILDAFNGLKVNLAQLSAKTRKAIGRPHDTAEGALKLLEREGFRQSAFVDLSDGGPIVLAQRDTLSSLTSAHPVQLAPPPTAIPGQISMVSTTSLKDFRACIGHFHVTPGEVSAPPWLRDALAGSDTSHLLANSPEITHLYHTAQRQRAIFQQESKNV